MARVSEFQFSSPISLNNEEFSLLRNLIFDLSGINLPDHKKELVRARLFKRLRVLGLNSFREYYDLLTVKDHDGLEQFELVNAISTNKTEFFRENAHFEFLKKHAFPGFKARPVIRILCAGCSTGEEPYSIAMTAFEHLAAKTLSSIFIHACDINTEVLRYAREGIYSEESVRYLQQDRLHRFFLRGTGGSAGLVRIKSELQSLVLFQRHNLLDPLPYRSSFEIIFCRNVVIYFNRDTQERVFNHFLKNLAKGGYLILGHSESLSFFNLPVRYIQPSVYQKSK